MKYDAQGIEATHQEMVDWVIWYGAAMTARGASQDAAKQVASAICDFLGSGSVYMMRDLEPCKACDGTGMAKLYVGAVRPACSYCKGTGKKQEEIEREEAP